MDVRYDMTNECLRHLRTCSVRPLFRARVETRLYRLKRLLLIKESFEVVEGAEAQDFSLLRDDFCRLDGTALQDNQEEVLERLADLSRRLGGEEPPLRLSVVPLRRECHPRRAARHAAQLAADNSPAGLAADSEEAISSSNGEGPGG